LVDVAKRDGAHRHAYYEAFARTAVFFLAHAGASVACGELLRVAQVNEGVEVSVGDKDDIPTAASVAAVGPSARDVFLAAETATAVSPAASAHNDARLINKKPHILSRKKTRGVSHEHSSIILHD
jgi:hypothetical protein